MRARMALCYSGMSVELREVVLREMPASLLTYSPKGTVPVLVLPDGEVIEESRDIIDWALARHDPDGWLPIDDAQQAEVAALLDENDNVFKADLDYYKYAARYPEHPAEYYRAQGEHFLLRLEERLANHHYLLGDRVSMADVAVFPFVRQFAFVDKDWFDQAPYPKVQPWLAELLQSDLFTGVMRKYPQWHEGDAVTVFP
jgi:glutathione S-transferase